MCDTENGITVPVTSEGRTTIPERFHGRLDVETHGRIKFVENDDGQVVVRPVQRPSEIRGALATEADGKMPASEALRADRVGRHERES